MSPTIPQMKWDVKNLEHEILIRCLYLDTGVATAEGLWTALGRVADWEALRRVALNHGVFPSLYRRVADTCPEAVPAEVLADWLRFYKIHARRNLRITTELIQILNLFESHGIIAVPYKGPVLAAVAYGDIALRQFVDLDILVSRKDVGRVSDLLVERGYRLCDSFTNKQERSYLRHSLELTYEHPLRTMLDIHWHFAPDYLGRGPDAEAALGRKVVVTLEGKTVYSLALEDMLLLLCLHGTLHFWARLSIVSDVAHVIGAQAAWNWQGLMQRAKQGGIRRQVLLGLSLAQELLGVPVPQEIIEEAGAVQPVLALHRQVRNNLFVRSEADLRFIERTLFYLKTRDCFKDQLAHVWIRLAIPTAEDWRWVPLPDSCYWLYYVIRPLRLGLQGLVMPLLQRFKVIFRIKAGCNHH